LDASNDYINQNSIQIKSESISAAEKSYQFLRDSSLNIPGAGENEANDGITDPFDRFWDVVEGLVTKIGEFSADGLMKKPRAEKRELIPVVQNPLNQTTQSDAKPTEKSTAMLQSYFVIPKVERDMLDTANYTRTASMRNDFLNDSKLSGRNNPIVNPIKEKIMQNEASNSRDKNTFSIGYSLIQRNNLLDSDKT